MKKAGVIILYNPDIQDVRKNISSYINFLDKLYVFDNSSVSHSNEITDLSSKIEYTANLKNDGISLVLNLIANKAIAENYDALLTMDQDSFFSEQMISKYVSSANKLDWSKISMIGISPKDYTDHEQLENNMEEGIFNLTKLLITSGSFLNLKLFKVIGGFNEKLFIDCVDYDYCLKSILSGYQIGIISNIYLYHVGGTPQKLLGRNIALYSPERYYYIFRNHIYMWLKYSRHFPLLIIKNIFVNITLSIIPNLILTEKKLKFLSSLIKAIKDVPKVFRD
jgi:rhamnosyltransferase